jgi:site-specific DNA-methyltransferase (adenine-specific)
MIIDSTKPPMTQNHCYTLPFSEVYNEDCIEVMKRYPDKYFDLAVVDPPYGIGATKKMGVNKKRGYDPKPWAGGNWDNAIPNKDYFDELFRVSKNQIIWGGNYFLDYLPATRCFYIWDKKQRIDQADCEMAWTSFKGSARIFDYWNSKLIGFMNPNRFHPTEKPIQLYDWLFDKHATEGMKILDTHLGSGGSRISANKNKLNFVGCEIDAEYFNKQNKRYADFISQTRLF